MRGALLPRDLTIPEPGSTTARDVFSRALGRLMREIRPLLRAHAGGAAADVATMERVLDAVDPGALAAVLRRPHLGALVRTLRATPPGEGDALLSELLTTLAFDLEAMEAVGARVPLRRIAPRVVSLTARAVVELPDRRPTTPYHAVDRETLLALADNNPLAMVEAHPDKHGNPVDLGGKPVDAWLRSLRSAFEVVARHMPDLRDEMALFVQAIVPVGYFEDKHLSASYREAIGTVYLSLHPNDMTMTEALVHEFQHNKLNALLELDEVLENAHEPLYASPVRPDPRPLRGVLLAVHAFLPVARLYEHLRDAGDSRANPDRLRDIARGNREGIEVLRAHARPTPAGQALLTEIERWDERFAYLGVAG